MKMIKSSIKQFVDEMPLMIINNYKNTCKFQKCFDYIKVLTL